MCTALKISESGYYRWLKNRGRVPKRQLLLVEIQKILEQHPDNDNYGVKRIHTALEQNGVKTSLRTVYRAMKESGYLHKRRVSHGITKADTETQKEENLLKQDFRSEEPLKKFLTHITEVPCANGKLYVSPVMDCFNGEIVALEIRDNMKKELCIDTVRQLKLKYGKQIGGAMIHSDRGSQYTSEAFREELASMGLVQSLSGVNHCYDNARMESFFATLKKEKLYRIPTYRMTREEVKTVIFRYIFGYYNTIRVNSFNPHGLPPAKMWAVFMDAVAA
jgi:transposase InsO family protein